MWCQNRWVHFLFLVDVDSNTCFFLPPRHFVTWTVSQAGLQIDVRTDFGATVHPWNLETMLSKAEALLDYKMVQYSISSRGIDLFKHLGLVLPILSDQ